MHQTARNDSLYNRFARDGYALIPAALDAEGCRRFHEQVMAMRPFGSELFLSETEYLAGPKSHYGTNPVPGRNLMERLDCDFVEKSPQVQAVLEQLLGGNPYIVYRKLVCRVPRDALPDWVRRGIGDGPTTTLGAFIKPEYRDIAYYHDNELHQDILDYARMPESIKEHRLITLYVYVSDVTADDAPTCVLPGTHLRGANRFPYDVRRDAQGWRYTDDSGYTMRTDVVPLPAPAGSLLLWHSCLLHGVRPIAEGRWRFGMRYMIACDKAAEDTPLDRINAALSGPLYLQKEYTARSVFSGKDGFLSIPRSDWAKTYFPA